MSIVDVFTSLHKSDLIDIYRHYMEEKELYYKRADGIKGSKPRLKRPVINGEVFAWRQFRKLPKEAIIVFVFTEGCDTEYLKKYLAEEKE